MQKSPTPEQDSTELVTALRGLVDRIRATDAGSRWFFERHDRLEPSFALWSHTTEKARAAAWEVAAEHARIHIRPCGFDADPAALSGLALDLAEAGSELALQVLCDDGLPTTRQLWFTALHLHRLTGHIGAAQRADFLFQCWQSWSAALEPDQRVELGQQADRHVDDVVGTVLADAAELDGSAWSQYLKSVEAIATAAATAQNPPLNYLLFDHARRTHLRIGVAEPIQASAARSLRTAHRAGLDVPAAEPESAQEHARTELTLGGARP